MRRTTSSLLPTWLRRTLSLGTTPVPWHDVVRSGVTVPVPLAIGLAAGDRSAGLFGALGALLGVLAERSGTGGQRTARIVAAGTAGVASMTLGRLTGGSGVEPLLVVLGFALVSGLLSSAHPTLSFAGMQLLVQMSIAGGLHLPIGLGELVTVYVGGLLWALAGVWIQSAWERTERLYDRAAADVVGALAAELRSEPSTSAESALDAALDLITGARAWSAERRAVLARARRVVSCLPLLNAAVDAVVVSEADAAERKALAAELDALGAAILDPETAHPTVARSASSPLGRVAAKAIDRAESALDGTAPAKLPPRRGLKHLLARPDTWDYCGRVMLCMGLAEIARQLDPFAHSYWILLTVALVLKPDFQSVFARTLQRGFGTEAGALLAVPLLAIPSQPLHLLAIGLLASGIPYAVRRNYWTFSVLITPIVMLILDYAGPTGATVIVQRQVNTAIGCAIVLTFGYALWPPTWRPPLRRLVADATADLAAFLREGEFEARRSSYRRLNAMHKAFGDVQSEPGPIRDRVLRWSPATHQLSLLADSSTQLFFLTTDKEAACAAPSRHPPASPTPPISSTPAPSTRS